MVPEVVDLEASQLFDSVILPNCWQAGAGRHERQVSGQQLLSALPSRPAHPTGGHQSLHLQQPQGKLHRSTPRSSDTCRHFILCTAATPGCRLKNTSCNEFMKLIKTCKKTVASFHSLAPSLFSVPAFQSLLLLGCFALFWSLYSMLEVVLAHTDAQLPQCMRGRLGERWTRRGRSRRGAEEALLGEERGEEEEEQDSGVELQAVVESEAKGQHADASVLEI